MYNAGDTVRSIRLGLRSIVPRGWNAVLPRDTEVALLLPEDNVAAEMYALLYENTTLEQQMARTKNGFEVGEGITLIPDGDITQRGEGVIAANAKLAGENVNKQLRYYIESKCNPVGYCVGYVVSADPQSFEKARKALQELVDHTVFEDMSNISPFANFDWKAFLSDKILLRFSRDAGGRQEDEVDLCHDGSFRCRLTRTGSFRVAKKAHHGKNKGTWSVTGKDDKATITLTFRKLPPISIPLQARDEQIYVNGDRYFVGESEACK
jgi:hypothetical protein